MPRDRVGTTVVQGAARVVLPHSNDPSRNIEVIVGDHEIEVAYRPEHIRFRRPDEALRFLQMLGDGRVELVVARNPVWTSLRSYRDGLALPFRRTGYPWPNLRFATERLRQGFV